MDPAQAMHEQVELAGVVADQADVQVEPLRGQTADQGAFGGQRHRAGAVDQVPAQVGGPGVCLGQYHRVRRQPLAMPGRQAPLGHIGQRRGVDLIAAFRLQQLQKVDPALGLSAGKPGEPLVADIGTVAVAALMAGAGIVGLNIRGGGQSRRLEFGLFLMEGVVPFREQVVELAGRDLDPPIVQLRQQQRLGHMGMIVLVQHVAHQLGPVMATPDRRRRHRRGHVLAGGEPPLLQQVAGIMGTDFQILHHKPPVAFEHRAVRYLGHGHLFGGVNRQLGGLGPL